MAKLSIREAAKHFEVSRPTLLKDIRSGRLSGELSGDGKLWKIDSSELARLYQSRGGSDRPPMENLSTFAIGDLPTFSTPFPPQNSSLEALKERLHEADKARVMAEARAEVAERIAEERGRHLEDLRRLLLTRAPTENLSPDAPNASHAEQKAPPDQPPPARSWWRFWG